MGRPLVFVLLLLIVVYALLTVGRGGETRRPAGAPPRTRMTRGEALLVLGLAEDASKQEIENAHRRLIRKVHPDTPGGSTYLASQINQARDVLLR